MQPLPFTMTSCIWPLNIFIPQIGCQLEFKYWYKVVVVHVLGHMLTKGVNAMRRGWYLALDRYYGNGCNII